MMLFLFLFKFSGVVLSLCVYHLKKVEKNSPNSLALFATDNLELKLAYTAINEHTNTHKRLIFRN